MGASDDSIREELIGAVLGELSLLRRDVKGLSRLLDTTGKQFKDDGELTLLRFTSRYEQFLNQFATSSTDVLAEAGRFSEARDQLLGEISLRQYDEANGRSRDLLRDVLRDERVRGIGRIELAVWTACAMLGSAVLTVGALAALRLLSI
ncbi:hypothetical protein DSC91_007632 (plasmid) [Paraburkholderia caffeinilytica]|uniref:Uncharacterized protein n=2 Tax=Paraburkholderia TaxID=1822464 RepID=A0A6J5FK18_9BURK|nr:MULTISPECIES: hypothetical protein [Paraburkholderia]AXL53947.1 hypothetical protein DSC91_007632 [Paraburkholderia caffeinilytica]GGC65075.1 hypothetical protein GCM10011400_61320 [Paraburkholderia caffeinilytica]CAB3781921.1 hypothetical protein LMG28688_01380 [Paraburkholderia caffeinitolerans]CAB3802497.1 hypothetical protein LMG28690_05585 [Paraburkholderia caffeinilytica]